MDWKKWGPHGKVLTLTWTFSDMHLRDYTCEEDQARKVWLLGVWGVLLLWGWGSQGMNIGEGSPFRALILPRHLCA